MLDIVGWCHKHIIDILKHFDGNMPRQGGAYEIGIHHGRLFIWMNQFIDKEYNSFAVDLFDDQELNIDRSGKGNLEAFRANLEKYDKHKGRNVIIVKGDSFDPGLQLPYGARFFSVDGGHTSLHVLNDLTIVERVLHNYGIVLIDDFINTNWLGVCEGVCRYLNGTSKLVPFCVCHNKIFLCRPSYHKKYIEIMQKFPHRQKIQQFFGHSITTFCKGGKI